MILAFDLSKAKSFEGLDRWYAEVEKYGTQQIVKMLVGMSHFLCLHSRFRHKIRSKASNRI